jgi:serine kinase of HPr protein (carbohydrate metabolism regulator)
MSSPIGVELLLHGSAVALGDKAALVRGPSGAGKSDLVLRCIAAPPLPFLGEARAELVADDQVELRRTARGLEMAPPPPLAGKIEVRGLGIMELPWRRSALLALVVDLVPAAEIERFPLDAISTEFMGLAVPVLRLAPFEASAPVKLLLALNGLVDR